MRELEHKEAVRLMKWARGAQLKWPQLKWLYAVPNGGLRNRVVAGKMKAEGVKAGVADYCLPWPMVSISGHPFHGLYLELKAGKNKPTQSQLEFLTDMKAAGYAAGWVTGSSQAVDAITRYLEGTWVNV